MLFRVRVPTLNRCIMNSPFNQLKDEGAGRNLQQSGRISSSLNCEAGLCLCSFLEENIGIEKKNIITININTCIFKSLKLCDHLVSCVTLSCVKLWKIFYQLWQNQRTSVLTSNIIVHNFCDTL